MQNIKKHMAVLSTIFKRELSPDLVQFYLDSFVGIDESLVCDALTRCGRELRTFPCVADVHQRIKTDRLDEFDLVGKIYDAIELYGYPRPDDARRFMGEVAWRAVHSCGGWMRICSTPASDDSTLRAQLRMAAQGAIRREKDFSEEFKEIGHSDKNLLKDINTMIEDYGKKLPVNNEKDDRPF